MRTIFFEVVPRTSESSIRMMRLPSIAARLAECFMRTPNSRIALGRLDEGAADIVVADDAELERHAGMLAVAERGRHAGIRHRHHDVDSRHGSRARAGRRTPCAPRRPSGRRRWNPAARNRCIRRCRAAPASAGTACGCARRPRRTR